MNVTGTITYDPVHRVSKKKEYAVRRTHLIPGLQILLKALAHGPPATNAGKTILREYLDRPQTYIATSPKRISPTVVDRIYQYLERVAKEHGRHPSFEELRIFLEDVETRLCRTKTHPWTAIVRIERKVMETFRQQLKERKITITPSAWGPHVTWVRRERPSEDGELLWGFREGERIKLAIDPTLLSGRGYWWVNIDCPTLEEYRRELGLNPKPKVPLHMTIGKEVACAGHSPTSTKKTTKISSRDTT